MSEDEARDACNELSQEHQGQKHGILQKKNKSEEVTQGHVWGEHVRFLEPWSFTDQFEHPWAAPARSEATEEAENNDGGSSPNEDIWCIGALVRSQGQIGLQAHLPPHPDRQQDHACELKETAGRVSSSIKEPQRKMRRVLSGCVSHKTED